MAMENSALGYGRRHRAFVTNNWAIWSCCMSLFCVVMCCVCLYVVIMVNSTVQTHILKGRVTRSTDSTPPSPSPTYDLLQAQPGLEAIQLAGVNPTVVVNEGIIGPWEPENEVLWANVSQDHSSIVINTNGLYFIYAQIYYCTREAANSFEIVKYTKKPRSKFRRGGEARQVLSQCSAQVSPSAAYTSEVSCYTGIVSHVQQSDTLSLEQLERGRQIYMKGFSRWGIIKLQQLNV